MHWVGPCRGRAASRSWPWWATCRRDCPRLTFPISIWSGFGKWAGSALAVAVLGLLEALAVAKSIAIQTREPLDYNRQCLAEGLANLGGGFFQCMPGSGSLTRSSINFQAGAVSRWSGVFAAAATAVLVVAFAPLAGYVPKAALAGILLVTAAGLVDIPRLRFALRTSRYDTILVLATAGGRGFFKCRVIDPCRHAAIVHHVCSPRRA